MGIKNLFETILAKTEQRFSERTKEREQKATFLNAGKIFDANPAELVERRLDRLRFDPHATRAILGEGLGFAPSLPGTATPGDPNALERVLGSNDLMGIQFLENGLTVSRPVARLHIRSPQGTLQGYGTGSMVSPRLLLTNNHVFETPNDARRSRAEFNFEVGGDGQLEPSTFLDLAPDEFFLTDPELDYTLVAVRQVPDSARFGWLRLIEEQGKLMVGEWVNIIQHPNGEPKQLALRENQVIDELEQFLHYKTDTAPGSSGSPVFNDQWEVVALHHSGVPDRDTQSRILTTDGRVWQDWMGEHRIAWKANEGARISRIVAHIKAQSLDAARRSLRDQLFSLEPPTPPEAVPVAQAPAKPVGGGGPPSPGIARTGAATWVIPLTVSVSLGDGASPPQMSAPSGAQVAVPIASSSAEDSELQEALAELAESRTRPYYDAEQDRKSRDSYYADIKTNVSAKTLFNRLSELVRSTHRGRFNYKPSRHVYPWVDLHPDRNLRSIYSGRSFDPETLIRQDFLIAHERTVRIQELFLREGAITDERMAQELDLLEAALPYNCEHVVPQSWFNKREPMRGDLHHLFACESGCNSFRSNIPYYDFPDFEEAVRDACGKRIENDKFEPAAGKGAVARATLYFLLRYPGQVGDQIQELQAERLPILVNWHKANPPDEYELHRNAAVFEKQGNRNPLIDHPEWVEKISFEGGLG